MDKRSLLRKRTSKKKDYSGLLAKLIRKGVEIPKVLGHDRGIRASSMHDLCMRERIFAYRLKADVVVENMNYTGLYYTQVGTKVHELFQDIIFQYIKILKGDWKCYTCGEMWYDQYHPEDCEECVYSGNRANIKYDEHIVVADKVERQYVPYLTGHVDGVICLNRLEAMVNGETDLDDIPEDLVLLELKTAGMQMMKKVMENGAPPEYYATQATIYQRASGYDRTMFLYINRDTATLGSFMYEGEDRLWNRVQEKLDQLEVGRRDGILPPQKECSTATCKRAKNCPFRDSCFGFEDLPKGLTEHEQKTNLKKVKI